MERKMYNLSKNLDVEEVTNMLLDDADPTLNEDLGEESEIDSHDEVEVCEVDSETEQDGDSDEDEDVESYYMGKDKKKQWNKKPLQKKRREPQNIITHLPSVIGTASNAKTAVECWNSLFTDDILDSIVTYTNQYIDIIKDKFICNRTIKATDEIELCAFFGLLYLAGAYRANRQSLEELWSSLLLDKQQHSSVPSPICVLSNAEAKIPHIAATSEESSSSEAGRHGDIAVQSSDQIEGL
ncbi:uncharacterized protein [Phyllobates terribilis]|uniref:uncharacterized protein n=1 Tax=Phyllobates terribilis TaxID=111132 RepID=UPI003CCAD17D